MRLSLALLGASARLCIRYMELGSYILAPMAVMGCEADSGKLRDVSWPLREYLWPAAVTWLI